MRPDQGGALIMTKTILVKAVTQRSAVQKITGALDDLVRPALPKGPIGLKQAEVGAALANCRALINQIDAGLPAEKLFLNISSAAELLFYLEFAASALKKPHHAHESVGGRSSLSILTDGAGPTNFSPREQVCSRTVGFAVQGHRQRAQGRHKSLPAITCQRSARACCYGVRLFGPRGCDTYSARLQCQPSRSRLGRQN